MEKTARMVWEAAAAAPHESHPKEPPRRSSVDHPLDSVAILVNAARSAFKYDWRAQLNNVRPHTHPQMRYDNYRIDKDKLFAAVKILNATPFVESDRASQRVLEAFDRLRAAVKMQNDYNRADNRAMSDEHFASHNLKALMELAVFTPEGSPLRERLESAWLERVMERDTDRHGQDLRRDLERGLFASVPDSAEAGLYVRALRVLHDKDHAAELKATHPVLAVVKG